MAALFGKEVPKDSTVLIVDIENSSVGAALVRLSHGQPPKLFAERRLELPLLQTISAQKLLEESDKTLRRALLQTATTAVRMRSHPKLAPIGIIDRAYVFISPPWVVAKEKNGALSWDVEPNMHLKVKHALEDTFDDLPVEFHATGTVLAHTTNILFEQAPDLLLCVIDGEVTELSLIQSGQQSAYATIPLGKHFLLRTLTSHAGLSHAEACSVLRLARTTRSEAPGEEALFAAAEHFARQFSATSRELLDGASVQGILVIAQEPVGEWAAQNLAASDLGAHFAQDTIVQALHANHLVPHLAAHAAKPDVMFMAQALFIDSHRA